MVIYEFVVLMFLIFCPLHIYPDQRRLDIRHL